LPIRRFPFKASFDALPTSLPDCHLVRTAIPFLPRGQVLPDQPRCFPPQSNRLLASFAENISRGNSAGRCGRTAGRLGPLSADSTQGRLLCTQHTALACIPQCRFNPVPYRDRARCTGCVNARKTGLRMNRVGISMPLEVALSMQARQRCSCGKMPHAVVRASPQHPPQTGRSKQAQEVSQVCPSKDF
jgi:hypothetical protein